MADNHSDFIVTILGSGTCVPSLRRSSCSVLMETAPGTKLLFDSGPGTMRRLLESNTTIFDLSFMGFAAADIYFTGVHMHPGAQ